MGLLSPLFFINAAWAAGQSPLQSELERLTESLDLLAAIKSSRRPADATALQTALNDILRFSAEEVKTTSDRMLVRDSLSTQEEEERDSILRDITSLTAHIKAVRLDITQDAGPTAVNAIAQKFKEWREGEYAAAMRRANAFAEVFENEDAISTASARLNAILRDEKKIRTMLAAPKTAAFARLVKKTQTSIRSATNLNAQAKTRIITNEPDSLSEAEDLTEESKKLLSSAYDDFAAMSRLVKK